MMAVVGILFTEAVGAAPDGVPGPDVEPCSVETTPLCSTFAHACCISAYKLASSMGLIPAC